MPDPKPRFTYLAKGRYWRFRHKLYGECALPGTPGDSEFHAAYAEKLCLVERLKHRASPDETTFSSLIERYLKSAEYRALADPTQLDYARTLKLLVEELGSGPINRIPMAARI